MGLVTTGRTLSLLEIRFWVVKYRAPQVKKEPCREKMVQLYRNVGTISSMGAL